MIPGTLFIVGPTGSGKSAVAVEVAQHLNAEIINGDAFQIYRDMGILTAQPSAQDLAMVPHHLYGFLDPSEDFDAARYATLANAKIQEVMQRGKQPIVVGGSGLYIKSLTHGLAELPPVDSEMRAVLMAMPTEVARTKLLALDPAAPAHINLENPRHIQRALEICLLTGKPASGYKKAWQEASLVPCGVLLDLPRDQLYQRIDRRTRQMFEQGVVQEIQSLGPFSLTARKALGLRDILTGAPPNEIIPDIQQATRRYAKRQLTWFKREKHFLPVDSHNEAVGRLCALLARATMG